MTDGKPQPMPVTAQEEREIHIAFEYLCDYPIKIKIKQEIADLDAWLEADRFKSNQFGYIEPTATIKQSIARKEELERELEALKNKPDKKVSSNDVYEILKFLGHKQSKQTVEEMIWEVDENLDGAVDWHEFKLMFNRNVMDQTGLEPNRMVRFL